MGVTEIGMKTNYRVLAGFLRGKSDRPLREKEVRTLLKLIKENTVPRVRREDSEPRKEAQEEIEEPREEGETKKLESGGKSAEAGAEKEWKMYAFSMEQGAPRKVLGRVPSFRFEM